MGWSVTINNLAEFGDFDDESLLKLSEQNEKYQGDAKSLLAFAKAHNLGSCTLAGGRTPNPYKPGEESVSFSIMAYSEAQDFNAQTLDNIRQGPDVPAESIPSDKESAAKFLDPDRSNY